jgi:hypothetical protein
MTNLINYINDYRDLDVYESPFNIVDALVLTYMIYLPQPSNAFELYKEEKSCNLFIANFLNDKELRKKCVLEKDDGEFAKALNNTKRYGTMNIAHYINYISDVKEEQFCAATFITLKGNIFISFCGTDITLIAWKENLNMSFEKSTNGQLSAVKYLNEIANKYPNCDIYLGGHSKGGNLAMYAGIFADKEVKNRIKGIYNFDGPGFPKEIIESDKYQSIRNKIVSIVPYRSLVGMVFEHSDKIKVVYSNGLGVLQHDAYTWRIEKGNFVYQKRLSKTSMKSHYVIRNLIDSMSIEERKMLVESIYELATTNNAKTTKDWGNNIIKIAKTITSKYKTLSDEQKKLLNKMFKELTYNFIHLKEKENKEESLGETSENCQH